VRLNDEKPDLSYRQLKVLLSLLKNKYYLENKFFKSVSEVCKISGLSVVNDIEKQKEWLLNEKVLVFDDERGWWINFDAVAFVVFVKYSTSVLYEFAWEYMSIPDVNKSRTSHSLLQRIFNI